MTENAAQIINFPVKIWKKVWKKNSENLEKILRK